MLIHIDLFSGIGGFALAAGWAGFRTVVFCEIDEFCQEVLKARFGAVAYPEGDIRRTSRDEKRNSPDGTGNLHPLLIPDIRDFDGTRWRGATLLTGGFPCQPFSCAGKRRGKADDRAIWPEMLRVIEEAKPCWIIAENVAGIVSMELGQVLSDLENVGYDFPRDHRGCPIIPLVPAVAVNAPHRRMRVWIVAHSEHAEAARQRRNGGKVLSKPKSKGFDLGYSDAPDTTATRLLSSRKTWGKIRKGDAQWRGFADNDWQIPWPEVAACLCRVDDGLPTWIYAHRVQRLKALGNAVVPQIPFQIIRGIAEIENDQT